MIKLKLIAKIENIFVEVEKSFTDLDISIFSKTDFSDLFRYHFSFGVFIRNKFLYANSDLKAEFESIGIKNCDDMSAFIIELFYIHCKGKCSNKK